MCRHQAWLGRPRDLASLVLAPEHGLERQSYQPRRQARGLMNADGWGVGFFDPERAGAEPVRWRSASPLWGAASFASVAPVLHSGAVLAAVRSASVGMPLDESAAAPFTDGRWLLSHNGKVERSVLPATSDAESVCDSAVLAAHVFARGVDCVDATVREVAAADPSAYLNLLLVARDRIVGLTWGDPLAYLVEADGIVVASEPYDDDPRWVDVDDRHLIEVTPDGITVNALEG